MAMELFHQPLMVHLNFSYTPEVVDGESKTYRYIPVYEVQIAYLKGDTDQYTIEIKCD